MTQATRNGLIGLLDSPAAAEIDQGVMDTYLSAYSSRADYEQNARNQTCFLAVLATAEYHEHWERTARPLVVWSSSDSRFGICTACGAQYELGEGCHHCEGLGASTVTEAPTDSRFERVVKP